MAKLVDVLEGLKVKQLACLDQGFVRLHEVTPRLVPEGRSVEVAIVENARISYGSAALRTLKDDARLVSYLIEHHHTSPLEVVRFTFHLKCPLYVAVHFLRHRTASMNQVSHRYTPVKSGDFYKLSSDPQYSIRKQDMTNRQGSLPDSVLTEKALDKIKETEKLLEKVFGCYEELVGMGVARESARFCLPQATYTELFFSLDLNNFIKFIQLRTSAGAQSETAVYAKAMLSLVSPLMPIAYPAIRNFHLDSMSLSQEEVNGIRHNQPHLEGRPQGSRADQEYQVKRFQLTPQ
jgi:thymidylate synthase (FAD)